VNSGTLWADLVARVRKERPLIASWVGSAVLIGLDGNTAIVGFPPEQWLAMESCEKPNNRKFLEALASELSGRPVALKLVKREGLVIPAARGVEAQPSTPVDPQAAFKDDPLIQRALEEFKAQFIPA
jgi:DNA polymerase-3 subunit gamma/tau